jgi:surface antigen
MVFADLGRLASALGLCSLLAGCGAAGDIELSARDLSHGHADRGTTPPSPTDDPRLYPDDGSAPSWSAGGVQCVPYARDHSTVSLHGDAYTWWDKASGVYRRGASPSEGAVIVIAGYAGSQRAHVAVVRRLVTPREIRIDHANWLNDGAIYVNDPVVDVSADNDWSQVKVWNIRSGTWGTKIYAVRGFIGPGPADGDTRVSSNGARGDDPIARQIASTGADSTLPPAPAVSARRARALR